MFSVPTMNFIFLNDWIYLVLNHWIYRFGWFVSPDVTSCCWWAFSPFIRDWSTMTSFRNQSIFSDRHTKLIWQRKSWLWCLTKCSSLTLVTAITHNILIPLVLILCGSWLKTRFPISTLSKWRSRSFWVSFTWRLALYLPSGIIGS